jgi:hypothetical protein
MCDYRKVTNMGGSAAVTLPVDDLRERGIVDDDGDLADAWMAVEQVGDGEWLVREVLVEDGADEGEYAVADAAD